MSLLDEAKEFFSKDIYATEATGIEVLAVDRNYAKCSFKTTPKHLNADGFVMGGAIYTISDLTFAVAANALNPRTVTLNSQISFFAPTMADEIIAEAKCVKDGKTICVYDIEVTDSLGKKIAVSTFTGFRKSK